MKWIAQTPVIIHLGLHIWIKHIYFLLPFLQHHQVTSHLSKAPVRDSRSVFLGSTEKDWLCVCSNIQNEALLQFYFFL